MCENENFSVTVPGSTSNLGSGFDTVSAALSVYLTLDVERTVGEEIEWVADWELAPEENIIAVALTSACRRLDIRPRGLRIKVDNAIPLKRGLGSSAAAIVGGIKIAERLSRRSLEPEAVFEMAYPLEGHPDNLSASVLGGWVISRVAEGNMRAERLPASIDCQFVLVVPDIQVSTEEAREILPEDLGLSDAVFNLQRCALLIHAISSGETSLLGEATRDRLHQVYRAGLVPGVLSLLERKDLPEGLSESVLSVTVSGSGSTVLAITQGHCEEIGNWMVSAMKQSGTPAQYFVLELDLAGARFV